MNYLLLILLLVPAPLGLDWDKPHIKTPNLEDYVRLSGGINNNPAVYVGNEDILDLETELQLYFAGKKIQKSVLILGPRGLNQQNCLQKFNKYINIMSEKYGKPSLKREETSFLKDEVLHASRCHLYRSGLKKSTVYWDTKEFSIKTILIGDYDGFYIETFYVHKKTSKFKSKREKNIIYKKISKEIRK